MEPRLSKSLLPDMELLKKMFSTVLDMKNANKIKKKIKNTTKDRMTHFDISAAVKRGRDNSKQRK